MRNEFLWTEIYRPRRVSDTILPANLKTTFQTFVDQKMVPNLLLAGSSGVGKTTIAKAMLDEIGCDSYVVNASLDRNIDILRNEITDYATSVSFDGKRKYVILDEADHLNPNSMQPALRNFMEQFSNNCGFILTCNYKNKIIKPLQSRCSVVDFELAVDDRPKMAAQFFKRVTGILKEQNVEYVPNVVAEVINKFFPDFRRVLNELQTYSASGKIDSGILTSISEETYRHLIEMMKEKNFTEVRKWVAENSNNEPDLLYHNFYDNAADYFKSSSIPEVVLILSKYQYQSAFVASQEINLAACMVELMANVEFK